MWVGPSTNPENRGPISTQNSWANLGPTYFFFLFFFGAGPDIWAGPELVRPKVRS